MPEQVLRLGYLCLRPILRAWWAYRLHLWKASDTAQPSPPVTPLVRIKNEDVWIETILRTLCKVFGTVIVLENRSQDHTLSILQSLKAEGLQFDLISYTDRLHQDSLVRNLVLDRAITSRWYYLVDGDELQFEDSCRVVLAACSDDANSHFYKMATHARYPHPDTMLMATPPFCPTVRHQHGRVFRRGLVQFAEPGWRDHLVGARNQGITQHLNQYLFLENAFCLHAVFGQRSSMKTWQGWQTIVPAQDTWRRSRYLAPVDAYVPLEVFPKEFTECRYSDHNPYRQAIMSSSVRFI